MADLFNLAGRLTLDTSQYESQLSSAEGKTSSGASSISSKLSSAGKAVMKGVATIGKGIGQAVATGMSAFVDLTKDALEATSSYQQSLGGAQAVFGEFADGMVETASKAYATMGMSADEYLQTANVMGSIMQGMGWSAEDAASTTSEVMQRAADVASIMGIDTADAMAAVTAAAKGNFTMMDNLGVAMNETTLSAYALEKGMTKSYSEMTTAEKTALAYQMFLEKTSDYAGNYAAENESIAGSISTVKAAWQNFLSGATDITGFVDSLIGAADVMIDTIGETLPRLIDGLSTAISAIAPRLPGMLKKILPSLVSAVSGLFGMLKTAIPELAGALAEVLPDLFSGLSEALPDVLDGIISALGTLVTTLIDNLPAILGGLGEAIGQLLSKLFSGEIDIVGAVKNLLVGLGKGLLAFVDGILSGLGLPSVDDLVTKAGTWIDNAWQKVKTKFEWAIKVALEWLQDAEEWVTTAWNDVKEFFVKAFGLIFEWVEDAETWVTTAWNNIKSFFSKAFGLVFEWVEDAETWVTTAWEKVKGFFSGVFSLVFGWVEDAETWVSGAWAKIKNYFSEMFGLFFDWSDDPSEWVDEAWDKIKTYFSKTFGLVFGLIEDAATWVADTWEDIEQFFNKTFGLGFTFIEDAETWVKNAWEDVKEFFTWNLSVTVPDIVEKVKTMVSNALNALPDWFKDLFGIGGGGDSYTPPAGRKMLTGTAAVTSGNVTFMSHKLGLDYVPYDGYLAELHEGERVLTKEENSGFSASAIAAAVAAAVGSMTVQLDGKRVGQLVSRSNDRSRFITSGVVA